MYDWVRALLDPSDIAQNSSGTKKNITPPPRFEIPADEQPVIQRNRRGRSVSPTKLSSPRKSRNTRTAKDVTSTPSTTAANASLQSTLEDSASATALDADTIPKLGVDGETEVKSSGSPAKKSRGRKSKRGTTAEPEEETIEEKKEEIKEKKKTEKKKKENEEKMEEEPAVEVEVTETTEVTEDGQTAHAEVSLDLPLLSEVPSTADTEAMIAEAKGMVEEAIKAQDQADGNPAELTVKVTKKRKPEEDDDEETSVESAQRAKKAKVLENKLKQERVRNRSIFGVSVAFALA